MLKNKFKVILAILISIIFASGLSIYATYNYLASDVSYTRDGETISVETALNELYERKSIQGILYVGCYTSAYDIKNNTSANITVNGLNVGEQYCVIVGRSTTGGANANYIDRGTAFTNATYEKYNDYLYNFVPSETSITITQSSVSFAPTCGSNAYAFVFRGKFE